MKMTKDNNPVYSTQILDFVEVAAEYCAFIEHTGTFGLNIWIDKIHKLLPAIYLKAAMLPVLTPAFEELNQRSVTENDYESVYKKMLVKLGEYDTFEEVFDPNRLEAENSVGESISENLADIYQDIKDFVILYEDGSYEVMYEAIWEVRQSFEQYWGQKLVNTLRALHYLNYTDTELDENSYKPEEDVNLNDIDTSNWIISRRQEDFQNDE
jgi:hypothetical protein